jgi:hypothetical protein
VRGWSFKGADEGAKTFDLIGSQADADARFGIVAHEHIAKDRSPVSQERALCADGKREDGVAARAGQWRWTKAAREKDDACDHRGLVPGEVGEPPAAARRGIRSKTPAGRPVPPDPAAAWRGTRDNQALLMP